jgi:3-oxoadipate enol-lactonase
MLVTDVAGILDAVKIERTHVVGLSMGGMVAQGLMLDHPNRVLSAVIADSRHTTTPEFTKAWHARAATVRKEGVEAIVKSTVERWSSSGLSERNPAVIRRMEKMIRSTSADGYCGCAAALARLNYGSRLGEIGRPVLVVCGTEDHGAPPENTRQMHRMIPNSEFLEIPQAGHIANIEQPAIFNGAVLSFVEKVERRSH